MAWFMALQGPHHTPHQSMVYELQDGVDVDKIAQELVSSATLDRVVAVPAVLSGNKRRDQKETIYFRPAPWGLLSASAPLSGVMISPSADVRETTAGVPHASDSNAASPKVSCGPGASATSADASNSATLCRSEMKPVKSTGNRAACRCNLARSGPSPTTTSRASTPASHNAATASMLRSARFSTDNRPQCTSNIWFGVAQR